MLSLTKANAMTPQIAPEGPEYTALAEILAGGRAVMTDWGLMRDRPVDNAVRHMRGQEWA